MWKHGLPNPASFGRLVYNRAADCLVVSMVVQGDDGSPFETIHARPASGRDYTQLDLGGAGQSFTGLRSCETTSSIAFNRMAQRSGSPGAFDWSDMGAFELSTRIPSVLLSGATLRDLLGGRQGWISDIASFDGAAARVVASVGAEHVAPAGASVMRYALCEIDLRAPALREIAHLPNAFM